MALIARAMYEFSSGMPLPIALRHFADREARMKTEQFHFASLADAIAALHKEPAAMALTRFDPDPAARVIVAVNAAHAAIPYTPAPGEHPDRRRDRHVTADVELGYLYRQLIERGHARQVLSMDDGRLVELAATRVEIADDAAVYAFVRPRSINR